MVVQTELEAEAVQGWGIPRVKVLKLGMAVEHAEVTGGDGRGSASALRHPCRPRGGRATRRRSTRTRGRNDLVRAVGSAQRRPSRRATPVHLVLAGPQLPELRGVPRRDCRDGRPLADAPGPVAFPGGRPTSIAALDVFAMPSRTDSFGIVFLEAWANACPSSPPPPGACPRSSATARPACSSPSAISTA